LPESCAELEPRTAAALVRAGRGGELGAHIPPLEIDEVRIVESYLVSHPETPQLDLAPAPDPERLATFVAQAAAAVQARAGTTQAHADTAQANGSSTTSAGTPAEPTATADPGGASRRTRASAIAPERGEIAALPI
ncbi:MAG: hypothetical protein QOD66_3925, partial [Solirubrobacteraceae bacterium]|nr:hypothetical protein [Solirubrobacteraceae bacterium]